MKQLKDLKFALIHNHTSYSDGWGTVEANVLEAAKYGHAAIGITDHGTCAGLIEHWNVCNAHNVNPILGCELYLRIPETWQSLGQSRNSRSGRFHMTMITTSFEGYKRLIQINNAAHQNMENARGKKYPITTLEMLEEFAGAGLVVLTGCVASVTFHDHLEIAEEYVNFLTQTFGKSNVYAELMPHVITRYDGSGEFNGYDRPLLLANKFGLKTVYTTDAHAPKQSDLRLLQMYTKAKSGYEFTASYIQSKDDAFKDAETVIGNDAALRAFNGIDEIVSRIEPVNFKRPFTLPQADAVVTVMKDRILAEFNADAEIDGRITYRGQLITKEILDSRLKQEWDLLDKYNFWPYFAVLWDILKIGFERGITTVARGSASGSYILYLLKVTQLHPVVHDLMFERFLAELRLETGELPDVDVDIPANDRHYIQEYAKERWGFEPVGTVHVYGHSSSVRMSDRVYTSVEGKEIPDIVVSNASDYGEEDEEKLQTLFDYAPWMKDMYDGLLGSVEKFGAHACAVVPTDAAMPVPMEQWGTNTVVNYPESGSNKTLQTLGYVKYDLLSSENLALLELLKQRTGVQAPKEIADNDPCFSVFSREQLTGLFQFDTRVGKNLINLMVKNGKKINSIRTLSDLTSLGRPGPLHEKYHVTYAESSADLSQHPEIVKNVFEQTNGVIIYQEQVSELFARIAFAEYDKHAKEYGIVALKSLVPKNQKVAQSDSFKAGYKKLYDMFVAGGTKIHKLDPLYLHELFESLKGFVRYGFNLSHSLSYANISAQEAWYKYNFPNIFWATILDGVKNDANDRGKLFRYIVDASLSSGLKFEPPHINNASLSYVLSEDAKTVQCPVTMVAGMGAQSVKEIIDNQPFMSLADIKQRTKLNKTIKLSMYNAGMLKGLSGDLYDLGVCDISEFKHKGTEGDKKGIITAINHEFETVNLVLDDGKEYKIVPEHTDEQRKYAKQMQVKPVTGANLLKVGTEILFFSLENVIISYKRTRYFEPLPLPVSKLQGIKQAIGFAIPEEPTLQEYISFAASKANKYVGYIVKIEAMKTKTLEQVKITLQDGKRFWFCVADNNASGFIIKRSKIRSYDEIKHLAVGDLVGLTLVMEKRDGELQSNGQIYDCKVII